MGTEIPNQFANIWLHLARATSMTPFLRWVAHLSEQDVQNTAFQISVVIQARYLLWRQVKRVENSCLHELQWIAEHDDGIRTQGRGLHTSMPYDTAFRLLSLQVSFISASSLPPSD
eukprot:2355922-Amphidinium_carterae.1